MHGANRLASNSLAGRAGRRGPGRARWPSAHARRGRPGHAPPRRRSAICLYSVERNVLQRAMSRYASVVRDADGLQRLAACWPDAPQWVSSPTGQTAEDAALTATARAIAVGGARARTEIAWRAIIAATTRETDAAQAISISVRTDAAAVAAVVAPVEAG